MRGHGDALALVEEPGEEITPRLGSSRRDHQLGKDYRCPGLDEIRGDTRPHRRGNPTCKTRERHPATHPALSENPDRKPSIGAII